MGNQLVVDGACSNNQHPSKREGGCGIVIKDEDKFLHEESISLGAVTSNQAEYEAVIHGLKAIDGYDGSLTVDKVISDSELIVKQTRGEWNVNDEDLRKLRQRLHQTLEEVGIEANLLVQVSDSELEALRRADQLAKEAR